MTELLAQTPNPFSRISYEEIAEALPHIVFVTAPDARIIFANQRWAELTGIAPEDLSPEAWMAAIHPDDRYRVTEAWKLASGTGVFECEYRIRRRDGLYLWHLGRSVAARDSSGRITQWIGTSTNIDREKRSREWLESLLMQSPACISIVRGRDHVIDFLNPPMMALIGRGREIIGMPLAKALPDSAREQLPIYDRILDTREPFHGREELVSFRHPDGTVKEKYFNFVLQPLLNSDNEVEGIMNLAVEVTEIVHSRKQAQEALRARDQFIGIAGHELRTPLTSLTLQLQLLNRILKEENPDREQLNQLRAVTSLSDRQISRLGALINDMLDISRISTGRLQLRIERLNLASVLRELIERSLPQFEQSGCPLALSAPEEISAKTDRHRFEQIAENLLSNARKYGQARPVRVELVARPPWVELSVTDQGRGIELTNQERIFHRFERAVPANEVSGLGLGLYIVRQIVMALGGTIEVKSAIGQGSTFTVRLPLEPRCPSESGDGVKLS